MPVPVPAPMPAPPAAAPAQIPQPIPRPNPATGRSPFDPLENYGPMQGQFQLMPQYANIVPQGQPRPMGLGEYILNPARGDYAGGWSSEMSNTVQDPRLNGGRPTIIPGLWVVNGRPQHVTEEQAIQYAQQSGLQFPHFPTFDAADQWSIQRENQWQDIEPGRPNFATAVQGVTPLWSAAAPSDQDANVMGLLARQLQR